MLSGTRDVNVEMRTVWVRGHIMPDTPNTKLRRIIAKADRWNEFWWRLDDFAARVKRFLLFVTLGCCVGCAPPPVQSESSAIAPPLYQDGLGYWHAACNGGDLSFPVEPTSREAQEVCESVEALFPEKTWQAASSEIEGTPMECPATKICI
jgi:hypothetical protein